MPGAVEAPPQLGTVGVHHRRTEVGEVPGLAGPDDRQRALDEPQVDLDVRTDDRLVQTATEELAFFEESCAIVGGDLADVEVAGRVGLTCTTGVDVYGRHTLEVLVGHDSPYVTTSLTAGGDEPVDEAAVLALLAEGFEARFVAADPMG